MTKFLKDVHKYVGVFYEHGFKETKTNPHDHCDQCAYSAKAHSATSTVSDRKKKWHVEGVKTNTAGGNSIVSWYPKEINSSQLKRTVMWIRNSSLYVHYYKKRKRQEKEKKKR